MIRSGILFDRTPGALEPIDFNLSVASDEYQALWPWGEAWCQELEVFHNPLATHPIPFDLIPGATHWFERGGDIATLAGPGAAGGDDKPARLVYYHDPILQRLWRPFTMTETRRSFKKSSFKKRKEEPSPPAGAADEAAAHAPVVAVDATKPDADDAAPAAAPPDAGEVGWFGRLRRRLAGDPDVVEVSVEGFSESEDEVENLW